MITMDKIPNEILKLILVQTREQHGFEMLTKCLLVSRLWNKTGTPVLYEHVVLHNGNIGSFLDSGFETGAAWDLSSRWHKLWCLYHRTCGREASMSFEDAEATFHLRSLPPIEEQISQVGRTRVRDRKKTWGRVHSLTLNIKPEGTGNLRDEQMGRQRHGKLTPIDVQLMRFAGMLPQFPLLKAFSFFVKEEHYAGKLETERHGPGFLDARVFQKLVERLPQTCTSLELDTNGREIQFGATSPRTCLLLRDMMPRLRHLSLRLAYVCEAMLQIPSKDEEPRYVHASKLRSLSVSFVPRHIPIYFDHMYNQSVCRESHAGRATTELPNQQIALGGPDEAGTENLPRAFQAARNQGCFPRAVTLQVVAPRHINRRGRLWSERETDDVIMVRDCVADATYALQILPTNFNYRYDEERALINRRGLLAMGNHEKLKLYAEEGAWQTTATYRARLPVGTPDVLFEKPSLSVYTQEERDGLVNEGAGKSEHKWRALAEDLMEDDRHPGRVFKFDGSGFAFRDFMPENF